MSFKFGDGIIHVGSYKGQIWTEAENTDESGPYPAKIPGAALLTWHFLGPPASLSASESRSRLSYQLLLPRQLPVANEFADCLEAPLRRFAPPMSRAFQRYKTRYSSAFEWYTIYMQGAIGTFTQSGGLARFGFCVRSARCLLFLRVWVLQGFCE